MKSKIFGSNALFIVLLCLVVILPVLWILLVCLENEKPVIKTDIPAESISVGASKDLPVSVSDGKSGLRKIWIGIIKDGKEIPLAEKVYQKAGFFRGGQNKEDLLNVLIEPAKLGLADGKAVLRMMVWDYSWQRWWNGNVATLEKEILIDTKRPEMDILSGIQNLNQGGSGIVIYRLSESCEKNGVYAGGNFFPGYPGSFKDKNIYISFFALEYSKGPGTEIYAEAVDGAGNSIRRGFKVFIKEKKFKKDSINISDEFLNSKMPEFNPVVSQDSKTPLADKFLKVNRDLRTENYNRIKELVKGTEKVLLWEGVFVGFPNAKNMAGFADHRDYNYEGRYLDSQVHLGVDLASVANAPVPAANKGKVVFTGDLGIYGKTVLLDHGYGLFSMYSHLNSFDVKEGQVVEKSGVIGRSGSTGLAAGDHLHFSMLVNNIFLNPLEWCDASWISNNVTGKIEAVKSGSN
ncbi:MAG: M23 family metallopeptidase [Desulfobacterales bacterium]|nr:M23 family metallopeptidase [Desulfobacterales bacterium]